MDISMDLTPAQIGMFIAFSIMIVGLGMAVKRRAMRKKQRKVEQDVKNMTSRKTLNIRNQPKTKYTRVNMMLMHYSKT